jgi:hypothetical protein
MSPSFAIPGGANDFDWAARPVTAAAAAAAVAAVTAEAAGWSKLDRFCVTFEAHVLAEKLHAATITAQYASVHPPSQPAIW